MASIGSNSSIQARDVATADIVVGLTSDHDALTIGGVVHALREGVSRSLSSNSVQFVLADAKSTDGTREAAREALGPSEPLEIEYDTGTGLSELPYHGTAGRATALRAILQTAQQLGARACVVFDARVSSVEPTWIERLVDPVLSEGFDYVSPYYFRAVNEGAITKSIVYPLFRALYGVRLRQPAATEFGCSGRAVTYYLEQDFWGAGHAAAGIDLWLAVAAVCSDFRVCEAVLGTRAGIARGTPADLGTTLAQIVGALFGDMEHRVEKWQRTRGSASIPILDGAVASMPPAPPLDIEGLIESFRLGYRELREIWTWVLPPRTIVELRKLTQVPPDRFRFDDRLWANIIYDFALGYSLRVMPHDHLLRSLTPLYTGWLASFVLEMRHATLTQVEERVEQVCAGFELEKRYLVSRWRWPERLR
jgi:hypothetical protein